MGGGARGVGGGVERSGGGEIITLCKPSDSLFEQASM